MGVLIDTSVLVAIERRVLTDDVLTEDGAISVVTVSELLQGVHRGDAARRAGSPRVALAHSGRVPGRRHHA